MGRHEVALQRRDTRQSCERFGHACMISYFLEGASALLEKRTRLCLVVTLERELPQQDERVSSFPGIVDLLQQREALFGQIAGGSDIVP